MQRRPVDLHEIMHQELLREQAEDRAAERGYQAGRGPAPAAHTAAQPRRRDPPAFRPRAREQVDVHELLKKEARDELDERDAHASRRLANQPSVEIPYGVSDLYMVLDSFVKSGASDPARGRFNWDLMVQGVTRDGAVGIRDTADTIIAIQLGGFYLPVLPEVPYALRAVPAPTGTNQLGLYQNNDNPAPGGAPTLVRNATLAGIPYGAYPPGALANGADSVSPWPFNPYTQTPFGGRVTVQFLEAGLQSFSDRNDVRHHFEFGMEVDGAGDRRAAPGFVYLAPLSGSKWDSYVFTEPLKDVHGVTLQLRGPDRPLQFEPDVLEATAAADGAAAPGPYLRLATADPHGLLVGDRVYLKGFASGVGVLDRYVNREEGHVVADAVGAPLPTGSPTANPLEFWLDPAPSLFDLTAPAPALPQRVTVYVAKRRLRIPVRLRRVVQRVTNYIKP